jgi:hypothetical protein
MRSAKPRRVTSTSGNSGMKVKLRRRRSPTRRSFKSLDYHDSMIPSPRRHRLAAAASLVLLACAVHAQTSDPAAPNSPAPIIERNAPPRPAVRPRVTAPKPASEPAAQPSALTADLFYEILMGEMTARSGDPGSGYALVLDAARRLRDGKLFQRAVEIALQSRSGDAALAAARAWQEALPTSRDAQAHRAADPDCAESHRGNGRTAARRSGGHLADRTSAPDGGDRTQLFARIRQEAGGLGGRAGTGRRAQEPDHRRPGLGHRGPAASQCRRQLRRPGGCAQGPRSRSGLRRPGRPWRSN